MKQLLLYFSAMPQPAPKPAPGPAEPAWPHDAREAALRLSLAQSRELFRQLLAAIKS